MTSPPGSAPDYTSVSYSSFSTLNTIDICLPRPVNQSHKAVWVVYIHGGAWRDPDINAASLGPAQEILLRSEVVRQIAGFASINYRLSPYLDSPYQQTSSADPAHNAMHPDHINDVLQALLYLQEKFSFDKRYILVGHSCGATLAFQVAMKCCWGQSGLNERGVKPPIAILGVEGLYDLPGLVNNHSQTPAYKDFISTAFGLDTSVWAAASPVNGRYCESWTEGRLAVIAHSHQDEMVELDQSISQLSALRRSGFGETNVDRKLKFIELSGQHDQVWHEGTELARAIQLTLHLLIKPL
ncbi:alpha/beta-hydrolase [Piedraia hortae CBS 480.64]|uniref:Kynurenine formamidase n=1 Tax=Piedraia hortae CBS 480.64 TaxID=1314780 RepID=A0A6A7C525_9PEZI|nr:alpha/beta-hydrolase [Piedraia hortae CBS 480.64]